MKKETLKASLILLEEQKRKLLDDGWSSLVLREHYFRRFQKNMALCEMRETFAELHIFASPLFRMLWLEEVKRADQKRVQTLLILAMSYVGMPVDLSGDGEETRKILSQFDSKIAPHDSFWKSFSQSIQQAYPDDDFVTPIGDTVLKRQLHQFRYVISLQQAEWVRKTYKKGGMTDAEALAIYLKSLSHHERLIGVSARLHNKAYIDETADPVRPYYPDGKSAQANYKVLLDFHTEFILDRDGNFLNEIERETLSQNGVVNGASFNYGLDDVSGVENAHYRYDVLPPRIWDPPFRDRVIANHGRRFQSPENNRSVRGYRSKTGYYSQGGKSAKAQVDKEVKAFKKMMRQTFGEKIHRFLQSFLLIEKDRTKQAQEFTS